VCLSLTQQEVQILESPLLKKPIEARLYQQIVFAEALKRNTLVVLPTGLGKTLIMVMLTAHKLNQAKTEGKKHGFVLVMSPTKPLTHQIYQTFTQYLNVLEIMEISGSTPSKHRTKRYELTRVIVATPQTIENDLENGILKLKNCLLICVDEAHRAQGKYAYVNIAKDYDGHIVGFTASPGKDKETVLRVCNNLKIESIEKRSDHDPDVVKYVHRVKPEVVMIPLPRPYEAALRCVSAIKKGQIIQLKSLSHVFGEDISKSTTKTLLVKVREKTLKRMESFAGGQKTAFFKVLGIVGNLMRLIHLEELLETQGIAPARKSVEKLYNKKQKTQNLKNFLQDPRFSELTSILINVDEKDSIHPKIPILLEKIKKELTEKPNSKILIFSNYRDTVRLISSYLKGEGIENEVFIGQFSRKGDQGLSRKKQLAIMQRFKHGDLRVLVSTSVGEEGIDVGECDLVIFYDAVPSNIRLIQRRGRTGRKREGKVIFLIAKGTRDEAYYYASRAQETKFVETVFDEVQKILDGKKSLKDKTVPQTPSSPTSPSQTPPSSNHLPAPPSSPPPPTPSPSTDQYVPENQDTYPLEIVVDVKESTGVIPRLLKQSCHVKVERLFVGSFLLSDDVCAERKTIQDLVMSIIDASYFNFLRKMRESYARPVLIIEGNMKTVELNVNLETIRDALIKACFDYGVNVFLSESVSDTAKYLVKIAQNEHEKRVEEGKTAKMKDVQYGGLSVPYLQTQVLSAIPNVNVTLAQRILRFFSSLKNVFSAEPEELRKVEGIGKVLSEKIAKLSQAEYYE